MGSSCYERDYGSRGCRAYDGAASDECQREVRPAWCDYRWCFVSSSKCLKPNAPSKFFEGVRMANLTGPETASSDLGGSAGGDPALLTYSYETCGNVDIFTFQAGLADTFARVASHGRLRVSIPGDEPPYITTAGPNDTSYVTGTSRRDGSIVRFADRLLSKYSIPWVEVDISQTSRAYSPTSSFTACVHDVALNNTDLCIGSFWASEFRRRLSDFTAAIDSTRFFVIAPKQRQASFNALDLLGQPFFPFDWQLWLALLATLLYAGYALYTLDAVEYEDKESDDEVLPPVSEGGDELEDSRAQTAWLSKEAKKQLKWARDWRHAFCPTTRDDAKDLLTSCASSLQSFLGGAYLYTAPHNPQSWLVFIGMSFVILVTVTNYTANVSHESTALIPEGLTRMRGPCSQVTSSMVFHASRASITSLEEGIERGYRFCGWASLQSSLEAAYPALQGLYVGLENGHDVFQAMDNRRCQAAIIDELAWRIAESGKYSLPGDDSRYATHPGGAARWHCDTKQQLPATVYSIDIALPVRSDLQRAFSWAITIAKDVGEWKADDAVARQRFIPQSACPRDAEPMAATRQLGIASGAGVMLLSVIATTLALVGNCAWRMSPAQRAERQAWKQRAKARAELLSRSVHLESEGPPGGVTLVTPASSLAKIKASAV